MTLRRYQYQCNSPVVQCANLPPLRWSRFSTACGVGAICALSLMIMVQWKDMGYWNGDAFSSMYSDDRKLQSIDIPQDKEDSPWTPTQMVKKVVDKIKEPFTFKPTDLPLFFRTAFLVTTPRGGIVARVTSVQPCNNKKFAKLAVGNMTFNIRKTTISKACPWHFAPHCNLVGYFSSATLSTKAIVHVPLPSPLPPKAKLYDELRGVWHAIELVDSRSTPNPQHKLAVCLQPMYLMADWPLIPNFFETWIGNGATLFFVYVQSVSVEVESLLRMYETQKGIQVIRVDWPAFPTGRNDSDRYNPNNQVYRTEVVTAVNDCALRARGKASMVVSSDLDEIIAPMSETETLMDILQTVKNRRTTKGKMPGAVLFKHSYAYAENQWSDLTHPRDLNFSHYETIDVEEMVWNRGLRSKVVMIPDHIYRAHVHDVVQFEVQRKYETVVIDPKQARVLHFRRVESDAMNHTVVKSNLTILANLARGWNDAWRNRLRQSSLTVKPGAKKEYNGQTLPALSDSKWRNVGNKVMAEIELCRRGNQQVKKNTCATVWKCRSELETIKEDEWVEPDPDIWVTM